MASNVPYSLVDTSMTDWDQSGAFPIQLRWLKNRDIAANPFLRLND